MQILISEITPDVPLVHATNYRNIKIKSLKWDLEKPVVRKYVSDLAKKMVKTCLADGGVGLAAPQLGILKTLFIIRDMDAEEKPLESFSVYFNPSFEPVLKDGKEKAVEGCLSVPTDTYEVTRWKSIKAKWYELLPEDLFLEREEILTGFKARVFLHEFDHLNAVAIPIRGIKVKR